MFTEIIYIEVYGKHYGKEDNLMNGPLLTYALVKSLYTQNRDFTDTFHPIVIKAFQKGKYYNINEIKEFLKDSYGLDIPYHAIETILKRLIRLEYLENINNNSNFILTNKGITYQSKIETDKNIERKINALIDDIKEYFKENNIYLNSESINKLLQTFLQKNISLLVQFINPSAETLSSTQFNNEKEKYISKYFRIVQKKKPEHYEILKEMVLGSIVSTILYSQDTTSMNEMGRRKFRNVQIFLDSNFLFSILDMDHPELSEPAKELFELLKKEKFTLKVFSFTVDEICRVVKNYLPERYRYPDKFKIDSIYGSLKAKGWDKVEVMEFIMNINEILERKGIQIKELDINLSSYKPHNEDLLKSIKKYKPSQPIRSSNHDIAAIEKIKKFRGCAIRNLEDCKYIFLTSDLKLSRFNFYEMNHKDNGTVSEVIQDRLLTNILWLKNPDIELPLKSIIALHSKDLFIQRNVWEKFSEVITELYKQKALEEEKLSALFYHEHVEDVLREFDESEVDKIDSKFVIELAQKVSDELKTELKKQNEENEKKLQELSKEYFEGLDNKSNELNELEKEVQNFKSNVNKKAKKKSRNLSIGLSILAILALIFITWFLGIELVSYLFGGLASVIIFIVCIINEKIRPHLEKKFLKEDMKMFQDNL